MACDDKRLSAKGGPYMILALFFLILVFTGCGYQFRADGRPVGLEIESLAIPMVSSPSITLGLEADFTRVLRQEFISYARVPIKPKDQAQMVLNGKIREIRTEPLSYNIQEFHVQGSTVTQEVTSRRRLRVILDIYLADAKTGKIIWHEPAMEEETSFILSDDPLLNRYYRKQALEKIARNLSQKIYAKTMERF